MSHSSDMISLDAAITACEKSAQWQETLLLLNGMCNKVLLPDVFSVIAAISTAALVNEKGAQWQQAFGCLMKRAQNEPLV